MNPGNGQVAIIPGLITVTGFSATATYTCNTSAGYILVGTVTRTCQDSGQWSGMVPECIRKIHSRMYMYGPFIICLIVPIQAVILAQ